MDQGQPVDLDGDWLVVEIGGVAVDPGAPRTVDFDQGRMSGRVGVNRFTGSFSMNDQTVVIGPLASTRMAGPPEMMELEARFNSRVSGEHVISLEGDRLILGEGEDSIRLIREPLPTFEDTGQGDQVEVRELPDQGPYRDEDVGL